ncbi:MAG: formyltransferase family protein, partial [Candidatus Omnitrophota bacterium]|nr:formyltransferase family protein [Candidatus Omnitrophota bacterium]
GYRFIKGRNPKGYYWKKADVVFVVGWQHILSKYDSRFVVLHDSLLPKSKGFCPTVNALIQGDKVIGVSASKMSGQADSGDIYGSKRIPVKYPIKIKDAYLLIAKAYAGMARSIMRRVKKGSLRGIPQKKLSSTYSIWRDSWDYFIDWNWPADKIMRFVDAVGMPYEGARTMYRGKEIFIDDVEIGRDLKFEGRQAGKIWSLSGGKPSVIAGKGMIRIISARNSDKSKVKFDKVRERFGSIKFV